MRIVVLGCCAVSAGCTSAPDQTTMDGTGKETVQPQDDGVSELRLEFYDPERPPAASKVTVHGVAQTDRSLTLDVSAAGSP